MFAWVQGCGLRFYVFDENKHRQIPEPPRVSRKHETKKNTKKNKGKNTRKQENKHRRMPSVGYLKLPPRRLSSQFFSEVTSVTYGRPRGGVEGVHCVARGVVALEGPDTHQGPWQRHSWHGRMMVSTPPPRKVSHSHLGDKKRKGKMRRRPTR